MDEGFSFEDAAKSAAPTSTPTQSMGFSFEDAVAAHNAPTAAELEAASKPYIGYKQMASAPKELAKKESVLQGINMGIPDAVDPQKNLEAMRQSGSAGSVMFTPGRTEEAVQAGKQILEKQEADTKAKREKLRQDAATKPYNLGTEVKDQFINLFGVGSAIGEQSLKGALNLATNGKSSQYLDDKDWNEYFKGFQSPHYLNAEQNVADAKGFTNTIVALGLNPSALLGTVLQSLPSSVMAGAVGGGYTRFYMGLAAKDALANNLTGKAAQDFILNEVKQRAVQIGNAASVGEGILSSGSIAEQARLQGRDFDEYAAPAIAAGIGTAAIGSVANKLGQRAGAGNLETDIASRFAGIPGAVGVGKGIGKGVELFKQGFEELTQNSQEQVFTNLATGKPWDEGLDEAAAQGLISGAATAGLHITAGMAGNATVGALLKPGVTKDYTDPQIKMRQEAPIVVSPLRQPLTSPAQGEIFQQGPKDTNTAPEYKPQEQLNLPSEITDKESGEVHALNPQQQVELQGLVHRYTTNGIESNRALAMAQNRILADIREQGQALDKEEPNATRPNAPAAGAGVPTSQQPAGQIAPTQGAQGAQPNGVVPNQPNAPVPITGKGQQPAPVSLPVQTTAPTPTVNAPVPQQNKPAIEPLPKDEFNERIDNLKEALRPYEHLEHGQMTPGQQQQFKNINAEILRLGLNQGLTRAEIHDLTYGKPEQKQANTWVPPEVKATTPTPTKAVQEQEAQPTRDMSEPIKAPEGDMSVEELRDNNEFSDQIEPEFHAHVADSAAIIDNPKAAVEAAKKERDAARMSFQNIESLYKNPDIEAQATKEQVDEARKDLEDAQAKLDAVEQKAKEITETQKQAGRQRAEGGGRKKQELTPEQEAAKVKLDEEAKARKRADTKARTTIKKAVEQLEVGHMPLTDAELDDPQGKAVHEMYKESLIEQAALALQGIVEGKILNGTKIQKAAKELLAQYDITKADIEKIRAIKENANKGLEDQLNRKPDLFKGQNTYKGLLSSSSTAPSVGKAIPAFNDAFTANAAITVIMKNGTAVEKYFANHIRGYVRDVNFVVIEKGDKLPVQLQKYEKAWNESRGLFIPESTDNNTPRTIYVRGSSFGENRGNDITTVLHELLHAAGMERLIVGVKNIDKDTKLTRAILDIASIRERARTIYEDMIKRNVQSEDFKKLKTLIDDVPIILFDDELTEGIAQGLDEFLAYSLSQDEMKTFLQAMPANGRHFTDSMFSRFVRGFMDALGIDSGKPAWRSGMTDLVLATNKLLTARYSSVESRLAGEVRKSIQRSGPPDKETRIELTKLIAELKGAKTDAQKIAYFENEKKRLGIELAKEDAGKYNEEWGMGIGRGSGTSAQGIKNRRVNAAYAVADLQNHYDDVIHSLENKSPVRSAVKRDASTIDMFGNDSTDEATQIRQRVKEKSAEIEASNAKFAARLEAHNKKPQSYLEKRMAARAAEAKAKLPPWHEAEQEAIKMASKAFEDIDVNGFTPNTINNYHRALTDFSTKNNLDFIDVGLETFDDKLYDLLEEHVKKRARDAAETAFDQRDSDLYTPSSLSSSLELARDSYKNNLGDTLVELGYRNYKYYDKLTNIADKAFDAEFENQKKKLPKPLEGPRGLAPRSAAIRKAKVQEEKVTRGLEAARISKNGPELGGATQNLQKERDPRNYVDQIVSIGSDPLNKLIASTWDVDAHGRNGARLGLPGLEDVYKNMQLMNGTTQKKLTAVANEIEALQNFFWDNPDKKEKFTELVTASTFDRYDPSNPKGKYNPAYDAMYKELGDAGQKAYKRLKEFYRDLNDEKQQLLKEQIDKLDLEPEERKKVAAALREAYEGSDKIDPYFPLMRFGDFVLDLGSGSNKISYRFESAHQRDKAAAIFANKVGKSIEKLEQNGDMLRKNDVNSSQMRSNVMNSSKLLKSISEAVNSTPSLGNAKYKDELMDKVYQTYLSFMPEQSVRKQFMHRKDIPGFSTDLIRVLGAHGVRAARQVARLQHGQDIRNSLGIVERQLKGNPGATPYYNKMSNYVDLMLNPPVRSGGYKASETTSSWLAAATHFHTLTSWASAFIQPVDIFSRAFPIIGAEYGYANTSAEMARMMKITSKYGVIEKLPDGTERWRMPSVSFANGLTEDEKFAIKAMEDSGVVKETMASTAYQGANGKYIDSKNWYRIKPTVDNLVMGGLMAHTERLSMELSYMAAFNAGMKFLKKTNPKMPHTEMRRLAADKAISKTYEAFGNYADYNKPGFFRHPLTRLVLMFKFYPYVLYKTMIGNMVKALPLLKNKGEKAQAMKKVFGIMGIHFLLGGLNATPGFSLAMMAAAVAFKVFGKDPDAPDDMRDVDFETWFRTVYLPEHLGHTGLAKLIEYGPFGAGFSSHISINNMLSFGDKPNESLLQTALDGFNAVPGAIKNYYDGGHALINGEYEKGFEKLLPGSLSSILAAGRIVEEGLRTSNGDQIEGFEKGKVPASIIAAQAVGFRPGEVINQQNKDFKMMNDERVVELERAQLSAKLKDAFIKSMDTDKGPAYTERFDKQFEEILDKMGEFGERHPEIAFDNSKDPKEINGMLEQALQDKLNREANAGVKLTDKNIRIFGDAVDYMKEQQTKK